MIARPLTLLMTLAFMSGCSSPTTVTPMTCPTGTHLSADQCVPNEQLKPDSTDTTESDLSVEDTASEDSSTEDQHSEDLLLDINLDDASNSPDGLTDASPQEDLPNPTDADSGDLINADIPAPQDTQPEDVANANPWPVPTFEEEPSETCQAAIDNKWYFQFLDNLCEEKVWPTDQDRSRECPTLDNSPLMTLQDGSVVEYLPSSQPVQWDTDALDGLLPPGMRVAVILIKRVDGVPHYRYLSNGTHDVAAQPWSTTKILAAANAAASLRIASDYKVGLTAKAGDYEVGDLVTSVCNYDDSPFTSNGLGRWFHDVGGRDKANDLIHDLWLKRPAGETFGGNYGDQSPPVPYSFVEPNGSKVTIEPDLSFGYPNNLSMHTLAEALKRLVLHREEPTQRLPGIQWSDLQVLLFGAEKSAQYGPWGGMTQDTAIYIQSGHDMDYIEDRSQGQWTIFSKLGLGSKGEFMNVGYACWPSLGETGDPTPGAGREFVISTHLDQGGNNWDERDRLLAKAYRKIILRIVDGRL